MFTSFSVKSKFQTSDNKNIFTHDNYIAWQMLNVNFNDKFIKHFTFVCSIIEMLMSFRKLDYKIDDEYLIIVYKKNLKFNHNNFATIDDLIHLICYLNQNFTFNKIVSIDKDFCLYNICIGNRFLLSFRFFPNYITSYTEIIKKNINKKKKTKLVHLCVLLFWCYQLFFNRSSIFEHYVCLLPKKDWDF